MFVTTNGFMLAFRIMLPVNVYYAFGHIYSKGLIFLLPQFFDQFCLNWKPFTFHFKNYCFFLKLLAGYGIWNEY